MKSSARMLTKVKLYTRRGTRIEAGESDMNIDERLDRLTERHEALALSLVLESVNIARLRETVEKGLTVDRLGVKVAALVESVQDLVRLALMHEPRIVGLVQA